eukprot:8458132-Pyramimonas_sp.AAC.1
MRSATRTRPARRPEPSTSDQRVGLSTTSGLSPVWAQTRSGDSKFPISIAFGVISWAIHSMFMFRVAMVLALGTHPAVGGKKKEPVAKQLTE